MAAEFLEGSRVGAVVLDSGFRILWVSRTFERYVGVGHEDLIGHDLRQLMTTRLGRVFAEPESTMESLVRHGGEDIDRQTRAQSFECHVLAGDGRQERWLESWSQPIRSGHHAGGRIDFYYDVTQRKQAEAAASRREDQGVEAQKMAAVGRFAGGLAHDFNNLLTAINGYTDLIIRLSDDARLQTYIGEIKKAGDRAADLTSKLLALSKPPPSQLPVADLNQVVRNLEGLLQGLIGEDVEIETRLAAGVGQVRIDPSQLEQVLLNLAVNARDAMPTGGRLHLATSRVEQGEAHALELESQVCIEVSDTGVGIDDDVREYIFEPFFTTKEEGTGPGLGLSMAYAAIAQNQGRIEVETTPGAGTTFRIYLPSAEGEIEAGPADRRVAVPRRGNEHILLVEDDASVRKLVCELLEQQGYHVIVAKHAAHALELVEDLGCDIEFLVTDVVMPGMSGPDLAARLSQRFPRMKILFMSGYTDSLVVHHGLLDAEHVMLQKPFDGTMLAAKVRELLGPSET